MNIRSILFVVACLLSLTQAIPPAKGVKAPTTNDTVTSLPWIGTLPTRTLSGYMPGATHYGAYLYYLFMESQNNPSTDPVVLWLQGGPGCSSLFGTFVENGPFIMNASGDGFFDNTHSWNKQANMIWIDQPAGTGYSYVTNPDGYAQNETAIVEDLYAVLQGFFTLHPEYTSNPFYIFGESYGGKYVPSLANFLVTDPTSSITLHGIGIGDGWVDPYYQTGSWAPFLYSNGLIDGIAMDLAAGWYDLYKLFIDKSDYESAMGLGDDLLNTLVLAAGDIDVYDIRYKGTDPADARGDYLTPYLNNKQVMAALHTTGHQWQQCDNTPYFSLVGDFERETESLIPAILEKVPVLLYNGNKDLICNWLGTNEYIKILSWPAQAEFESAHNTTWYVNDEPVGAYKSGGNLTQMIVDNAGHMSPFDQPENVQQMFFTFLENHFNS